MHFARLKLSSRLERINKLDRDYSYYIIIIKSLHKVTHFYRKLTITLFDPNKKKKHVKLVQKNAAGSMVQVSQHQKR